MKVRFGLLAVILPLLLSPALAQKKTGKDLKDAVNRVNDASAVMTEIMRVNDRSIPRDLLESRRASCLR